MVKQKSYTDIFFEIEPIGSGSFGNWFKVIHFDSGLVALLKKSNPKEKNEEKYCIFIKIL